MITIIPAIDIIDGKCVRLSQGDYSQKKVYNEDPLEVAKMFENNGIRNLHLVDLDGAKAKQVVNIATLDKIVSGTHLEVDFGGGIKTDNDIRMVFNYGASQVTVGTVAVVNPELFYNWINEFGSERIILGADIKDKKIAVAGWLQTSEIQLSDFIDDYRKKGIKYILCTDISKDGMLQGTSLNLYKELKEKFPELKIIASGGITDISEIDELNNYSIYGVIIGKAIYERKINIPDLKRFL